MGHPALVDALLYAAIAVLVLWRVVVRQLLGSAVTVRAALLVPGILVVIGVVNCARALPTASGGEIAFLGADLILLLLLGAARAASTRVSIRDGFAFQKGGPTTMVLWLATIGIRVGSSAVAAAVGSTGALSSASVVLSLGLSIGVQNVLVLARARRAGLPVAGYRGQIATARR